MTTDRRALRTWALALVLALVAVLLVATRPAATTLAAWSDEVTVEVPVLSTGGIGVGVTPGAGTSARIVVSGDVSGTWRPSRVRVTAGGQALTGAQLDGSRIEYRIADAQGQCATNVGAKYSATPSGTGAEFTIDGDGRESGAQTLCLTFVPSDKVRVSHGGQALTFATSLDGAAQAAGWTAASSWSTNHQLPAAPTVGDLRCAPTGRWDATAVLHWNWTNGDGTSLVRWEIQRQDGAQWHTLQSITDPRARSWSTSNINFPAPYKGRQYNLRAVAVLGDGSTHVVSDRTTTVQVNGILIWTWNVSCAS